MTQKGKSRSGDEKEEDAEEPSNLHRSPSSSSGRIFGRDFGPLVTRKWLRLHCCTVHLTFIDTSKQTKV